MDDKLPASTDFSQGPNSYGEISGTFVNSNGKETPLEKTKHLSPIPMRPIGTFAIRDKKTNKDIPTESIQNILRRNGPKVGGELKPNQEKLLRERRLIELGEAAEDAGLELGNDNGDRTLVIPDDMFEDPEKVQKIKERLFSVAKFIHLKEHWEMLLPKMNTIDANVRSTFTDPIIGAFDALAWLQEAPETGDETIQQIDSKLQSLQVLINTFEEEVAKNTEPEKKNPDSPLTSPENIQELFTAFDVVSSTITHLKDTLGDNFTLRRFHADIITSQNNTLLDLQEKIKDIPTEKDVTAFEITLKNLSTFLPKIEEEVQLFIEEEKQLASVAPISLDPASVPVVPTAPTPTTISQQPSRAPTTIETTKVVFENNIWLIQRGGTKERMKSNEFLAWQPIIGTLRDYKKCCEAILTEDPSYDLSSLSSLKDEILDAIEKEDFTLADAKARELGPAWRETEKTFKESKVVKIIPGVSAPLPTAPTPDLLSPEEKKKQALIFDVWKPWPGSIVVNSNGNKDAKGKVIGGTVTMLNGGRNNETISLPNYEAWAELKKRFDACFTLYNTFLRNGETNQKITANETLIRTKNEVLAFLLTQDLKNAFVKIEEFEILLNEAPEAWKLSQESRKGDKEKAELAKNEEHVRAVTFTKQKARHVELFKASEKIFIELNSPLEKKIIVDKLKKLNEQEIEIDALMKNHDENALNTLIAYEKNLNYLSDLITGINKRLEGMGPVRVTLSDPKTSPFELRSNSNGTKSLHAKEETITYHVSQLQDAKKIQAKEEVLSLHRKLFNENTERYLNHYFGKPLMKDDPNKEAFESVIAQYREQLEKEIALCSADIHDLERAIIEATSDAVKFEKNAKLLHAREVKKEAERKLGYIQTKEAEGSVTRKKIHTDVQTRLITSTRQTYSPEHDASIADMGRTRSDLTFTGRRAYDKAQSERKDRLSQENTQTTPPQTTQLITDGDILKVQGDNLRGALMALTTELHTEDDIKKNKPHQMGMVDKPASDSIHAVQNEAPSVQTVEEERVEPVLTEEIATPTPEILSSQEYKERRHQAVGRLAKILEDERVKKIGRSWRALALATLTTIVGGKFIGDAVGNPDTPTTSSPRAKTLGEAVTWKDHLNPSQKEFLNDLTGSNKLSFLKLTEKHAVPFFLNGPSSIGNLKMMEPAVILNSTDSSVYGIRSDEERSGLSNLITQFATIIRASDVNNRHVPNLQEKLSSEELNAIVSKYPTMEQLYQATIQIATQANSK